MQLNMGLNRHHSKSEKQWRTTLHDRDWKALSAHWQGNPGREFGLETFHHYTYVRHCWNRPHTTDGHGDKTVIKGSDASASAIVTNARVQLCANIQERKINSSRRCSTLLIFTRHAVVAADFCEQSLVSTNQNWSTWWDSRRNWTRWRSVLLEEPAAKWRHCAKLANSLLRLLWRTDSPT